MNDRPWLDPIIDGLQALRCAVCGAGFERSAMRGVANGSSRAVVEITCGRCGERVIAIIDGSAVPPERPIVVDDVLEAHERLAPAGVTLASLLRASR